MFGIDWVQIKSEVQKILLVMILLIIVWNPVYTLILLAIGFTVRKIKKYKQYFMWFIIVAIIIYVFLLDDITFETIIPCSLHDYLLPLIPIRMIVSLVFVLVCTYFDFGNVDKWMIEDEKRRQRQIYSTNEELCFKNHSHVFIAGTTGSGKTQLLLKYIRESFRRNEPLYIISGKGSGDKDSMLNFVREMAKKYKRKIYIVSMNPQQKDRVPYNPFKNWGIIEVADALCNATNFTEPHYKEHLSCWVKAVCECMQLANITFSLQSILDFMDFDHFRYLLEVLSKDKLISKDKVSEYLKYEDIAKVASTSRARFLNILLGEGKEIIGDEKAICASDVKAENAILFLDMDSFSYSDFTQIIGAFFINDMRHIVANDTDGLEKRIVMDELSTYVTSQIMPLFSQSRSRGYQLVVATQSIADLDEISPVFAERVMENCGQYGILQLNSANDAERISMIIGTTMTVETTRKSTGMQLHHTADGSKKVVNAFKITPDRIKELKPLEVLFYDKKQPEEVKNIKIKYGWDK